MTERRTHRATTGAWPEAERADHVLIAAPNRVTQEKVRGSLAYSGVGVGETELGLRVDCRGLSWPLVLESVSVSLSALERRGTRVAVVPVGCDPITARHAVFSSESIEALLEAWTSSWVKDLLVNDRIRIDVQPILQTPPGRVHGYECLMRGVDEDGSMISPARVFSAAERLGLTPPLEVRCRTAALRRSGEIYRAAGDENLNFFINFIPSVVQEPMAALRTTVAEVEAAGLKPSQVTFEVVETDKVEDTRKLLTILRCFRKAGFKVALDDVGAGYASLLSISTLRPDYIKLDGELVRRAAHSALERKLVADLAETARQNGIMAIAEGIETEEELKMALGCGIRLTQGYLHARPGAQPLTGGEVEAVVRRVEASRGGVETPARAA